MIERKILDSEILPHLHIKAGEEAGGSIPGHLGHTARLPIPPTVRELGKGFMKLLEQNRLYVKADVDETSTRFLAPHQFFTHSLT